MTGFLIGVVGVAVAVWRFWPRRPPNDDEDRPAIIIKNGSITFENEGGQIGWAEDGGGWHPDQPRGKKIKHFIAEIKNADAGCTRLEASHFVITFRQGLVEQQFNVFVAGKKPKITPKLLRHDRRTKMLRHGEDGDGRISSIQPRQGGTECTFPSDDGEIWLYYAYDED